MVMAGNALEMTARSEAGLLRSVNEDAVTVDHELGLAVVADGMGGRRAGGVAARLAVATIERTVRGAFAVRGAASRAPDEVLREAVVEADRLIRRQGKADVRHQDMGATVACLLVRDGRAHIAHVGDTRVYRLRAGTLQLLTRDHTFGRYARDAGVVNDAEFGASHNRHLVTQALGAAGADGIEIQQLSAEPGDLFLLCSDGLNEMVDGVDIELVLDTMQSNLPLAAEQLVMIACDCGGHDNVTVALVRVGAHDGAEGSTAMPVPAGRSLFGWLRDWLGRSA